MHGKLTNKAVAEALDGLPPVKMHCSNLAADALHKAIKQYRNEEFVEEDHHHQCDHANFCHKEIKIDIEKEA